MAFLPFKRSKERQRQDRLAKGVMRPSVIRWPLFIALGLIIYQAYSWNFSRRFAEIEAKNSFLDQTQTWTAGEKQEYFQWSRKFKERWGLNLLVQVRRDQLAPPASRPNTLYIGVLPDTGEASVVLPPLLSRALDLGGSEPQGQEAPDLGRDLGLCLRIKRTSAPCVLETISRLNALLTTD